MELEGGVVKTILREAPPDAQGPPPQHATVYVHIEAASVPPDHREGVRFLYDIHEEHEVILGRHQTAPGLETALYSMHVGERAVFRVPASLSFKEHQLPEGVLPEDDLKAEVVLLRFEPEVKIWDMDDEHKFQYAVSKRETGNVVYAAQRYRSAVKQYDQAILFLEAIHADPEDLKLDVDGEKFLNWLNIAQCQLKLKNYQQALKEIDEALKKKPENVKGQFRRAVALRGLGELDEAMDQLVKLQSYRCDDKQKAEIDREVEVVKSLQRQLELKERSLYGGFLEKQKVSLYPDKKIESGNVCSRISKFLLSMLKTPLELLMSVVGVKKEKTQ